MAEPLKTRFGPDVPRRIAAMVEAVHSSFPSRAFVADALDGYERLELTPRVEISVNDRAYPAGTFTVIRTPRSTGSKRV
jgi:hypothetical protein